MSFNLGFFSQFVTLTFFVLFFSVGCQNRLRIGQTQLPTGPVSERPAAQPQPQPEIQPIARENGFDLQEALATPQSLLVLAIGHAEGTIDLQGNRTQAYYGHNDSGFKNVGVFSCISCGNRTPEQADRYYLEKNVQPLRERFESAARAALLPADHPMLAAAFFTLLVQSPAAATDRKGFLERMAGLKMTGITYENLLQTSVDSYRDPDTNRFEDVERFGNDESRIRADQKRRLTQVENFLRNRGVTLYPRLQ
ncbi:MAG: hypothetical protein RJB13_267 [Pseudomonadota bacterium]|jgi:hypothetical protein